MLSKLHAHRWSNPRLFFAADKDDTGGASPKEPATLAEAKAEIARAREEAKGANEARTAAEKERDDVKAENVRLTEQFNSATTTATTAQADLKAAKEQVTTLTTEKAELNTKLTTANENVTRLEKLCGLNGVDPKAAVPSQPVGSLNDPRAALSDALKAAQATRDPIAIGRAAKALRDYDHEKSASKK